MKGRIVGGMAVWLLTLAACAPGAAGADWEAFNARLAMKSAQNSAFMRQPAPGPARPAPTLRRMRKGTISLGGQMSYGVVRGSSELNDHFDHGVGYAFRVRYSLSSRAALGFSFEHQGYDARAEPNPQPGKFADSSLVVTTVASEAVVFFQREKVWTPYLLGGFGFASPNVLYEEKEVRRVNEGVFVVLGGGIEKFVRSRFSIDLSLRGYAQLGNSELSLFSQASAGIHLYPGD